MTVTQIYITLPNVALEFNKCHGIISHNSLVCTMYSLISRDEMSCYVSVGFLAQVKNCWTLKTANEESNSNTEI